MLFSHQTVSLVIVSTFSCGLVKSAALTDIVRKEKINLSKFNSSQFSVNPCAPNGKCPEIAKWSLKLSLKVGDDNYGMSQLSSRVSLVVCEFHGCICRPRPSQAHRGGDPAGEAGRPVPPGRHGTVRSCNPQSPLGSCSNTTCELMRQANTPQQQQLYPYQAK